MTITFDPKQIVLPAPLDGGTGGDFSRGGSPEGDLGRVFTFGDKQYRLVKAEAAITDAAAKILVTDQDDDDLPTWEVNTTTTASNILAVGLVPDDLAVTDIPEGAYFFVVVSGVTPYIAISTDTGGYIGTGTTAGRTLSAAVDSFAAIGISIGAAGGAGQKGIALLRGNV